MSGGERTAAIVPGADLVLIEGWGHDLPPGAWPQLIGAISTHCLAVGAGVPGGTETGGTDGGS